MQPSSSPSPSASSSSSSSVLSEHPALSACRPLLGSFLRISLKDGRVLVGRLHCVDWQQNIILRDTELWLPLAQLEQEQKGEAEKRAMGQVAVAARHVLSYEAATL